MKTIGSLMPEYPPEAQIPTSATDYKIYLLDPIELMESRIDRYAESYNVDAPTCMVCGKCVDYDLICLSPLGDGAAVCEECAGL